MGRCDDACVYLLVNIIHAQYRMYMFALVITSHVSPICGEYAVPQCAILTCLCARQIVLLHCSGSHRYPMTTTKCSVSRPYLTSCSNRIVSICQCPQKCEIAAICHIARRQQSKLVICRYVLSSLIAICMLPDTVFRY